MLPNRIVAVTFVALLALQVLPAPASAQLGDGPDLKIEAVDAGGGARTALVSAPVNVTVRNVGSANFPGTTGWMIFLGLNGVSNAHCIEPGAGTTATQPSPATSPCYIRVTPGNQQGHSLSIPAGEARTYTMLWDATREQANQSATVYAEILPLGGTPGGDMQSCTGPDGQVKDPRTNVAPCENNRHSTPIFVGEPGVRSVPKRQPSPSAVNGNTNSAWKETEVQDNVCPVAPAILDEGCKVRAGRSIAAAYDVTNVGTVDDSYTPSLVGNNVQNMLTAGYTFNFAPQTFSLGPGQKREVKLTIFIPENVTAEASTNLGTASEYARWTSTRAPVVDTADDQNPGCQKDPAVRVYCVNPTLPTFVVDFRRAFNITANYTFDDMDLSETSEYQLNITNEGNAEDSFNITFVKNGGDFVGSINDSWSPRIDGAHCVGCDPAAPTAVLAKGANKTVRIQIKPPNNVTNGTHFFEVQVKSKGDTDGTAPCKRFEGLNLVLSEGSCKVRFYAHVRQRWEIDGFGDVAARVVPGETVVYNLGMTNNGNGYDNVTLELQTTVFGWDVRLSNSTLRLTPFNTTPFTLTVTSPPKTDENTIGAFFVNATPSGPQDVPLQNRNGTSIESQMTIIRGSNIRLEAPVNTSFVDAGAVVDFNVLVTNIGNIADNFTIPTPERPADWGVTVTPEFLDLQPNQQGTVKVSLRAPAAAEVGEKATATLKARSTVDRSREKSLNLEARISGPDLFVDNVLVNSTNPYSGDPLEVSVVLGNSGNKAHDRNATLKVYFVQGGVERVIGELVYPALFIPGQRRLTETFPWDTTNVEGPGVLLARIDTDNNVKEIDDSAASNERTRALTLRTFDIKLTPAQGLSARPGEKLTYSESPNVFIARYDGNQPTEPVTIRFESEHGWLTSRSELTLALPRGTPIPIIASLDIPTLPGAARDTLTMTVVPALRPEETLRASATTTIIDEEKPIVRAIIATPAAATLGETVAIEVLVEDATGASSATAYVTFPTNETSAVTLVKVAPDRFRGERTFTVAGRYRVAAEVLDAADPPNKNDTRLALGSFVVSPGSAPTIRLAPGQATTIRTGSPIKLDIRDPLGIGDASYSIQGVTYELNAPGFQIDTSTFQAGTIKINVTAENIYGVSSSQEFTFLVDNAAPGITRVTISPERPRANADVTITVQTEAKVEAVDILVKRDGQVVQTLNATKRGVGTFVATFNPSEGDYTIDVTARDAAGNTKLQDRAVVFSARAGSPLPGPAPWMLLVGVVALALLMRRSREAQ